MKVLPSVNLGLLKDRIYYSQNREDMILDAFFPGKKDGFYVDVGGYDPDFESVTKLFHERGWRGINIEPQPDRFEAFVKRRKKDINLNIGVSNMSGTLTLRSYNNQGLSTFSEGIKEGYIAQPDDLTANYKDIEVSIETLEAVFKKNNVKDIDFLKIDVEGLEYEVLDGNNWETYRPKVVCIEANHIVKDWHKLVSGAGYELVFSDGLNEYYADSSWGGVSNFDYVKHVVIERGGGIRASDYEIIKGLQEQSDKLVELLYDADKELNAAYDRFSSIPVLARRIRSLLALKFRTLIHKGANRG